MHPGVHAAHSPDKPAAVQAETGQVLTYGTLAENSRRLARYLHDRGLRPDDHIALLTDNTLRAFEVHWAAPRSGLHITAVNRHLAPAEVSCIVNDCGARALVVSARLGDLVGRLDVPGVGVRLVYGDTADTDSPDGSPADSPTGSPGDALDGYTSYERALVEASAAPLPDGLPRGNDMLYSSGTTGRPKGVRKPLPGGPVDELPTMVASIIALNDFDRDTVYLSPAPIYHAAPLRFAEAVHSLGGTVVPMERFDAEEAGGPGLADELRAHLRERIAGYKVPRTFDFVDEPPRTPSGKLLKHQLRRRYTEPVVPAASTALD